MYMPRSWILQKYSLRTVISAKVCALFCTIVLQISAIMSVAREAGLRKKYIAMSFILSVPRESAANLPIGLGFPLRQTERRTAKV